MCTTMESSKKGIIVRKPIGATQRKKSLTRYNKFTTPYYEFITPYYEFTTHYYESITQHHKFKLVIRSSHVIISLDLL